MESTAVSDALDAVAASVAALSRHIKSARPAGGAPSDLLRQLADDCLDGLTEASRLEAKTAALKVELAAALVEATKAMESPSASPQQRCATDMALVAEVACVLTISERTAGAFLHEARQLTTALPLTLASLQAGTISWQHARILVDETTGLDRAATAGLEAHFLDPDAENAARGCPAGELVPSRFRAKARTWRERHHSVSIEKRHQASAQDRRLEFTPDRDGMAWLSAYLPADAAASIWNRATAAARAFQGPGESRNLSQLRADTAANWLIAGVADGVPSPKAQVLVTVPVLTLMGATEEPAMLDGYGPIPPSMARRLVADGASSFHRVLTDPASGTPLEIGRSSHRVPNVLRQWLRLRDGRCPFPGCNNQSLDNEADHALAWHEGGTTGVSNLSQPCRKHHRLKHTTGWQPMDASRDAPPGWMAPSGRRYTSEEQDWEPPWQPHDIPWPRDLPEPVQPGEFPPDIGAYLPDPALVDPLPDWEMWLAA
ncbi:endonuclease [Arthrobacter sp. Leaf337]|uniref:HNH endonuclease signature motif containing protein n=1 Tax=Arthrobacter sp. Leaf337 TaxID=1736342 RepID=UPI0006F37AAE|nr:HNH endonuclease signature motif containing protein [Arthrobacter sp. Leaf337]KQR80122.1 endonuclease [Arthrobacter sp. Leaf337]